MTRLLATSVFCVALLGACTTIQREALKESVITECEFRDKEECTRLINTHGTLLDILINDFINK